MFKIGETVVCVAIEDICKWSGDKIPHPKINEKCVIKSMNFCDDVLCAKLEGYPSITNYELYNFRKLDHTFAEEVTARIEEEINQENLVGA